MPFETFPPIRLGTTSTCGRDIGLRLVEPAVADYSLSITVHVPFRGGFGGRWVLGGLGR